MLDDNFSSITAEAVTKVRVRVSVRVRVRVRARIRVRVRVRVRVITLTLTPLPLALTVTKGRGYFVTFLREAPVDEETGELGEAPCVYEFSDDLVRMRLGLGFGYS